MAIEIKKIGVGDRIMVKSVFFKKPELSKGEFNQRLGRWFIRVEETKEIARQMEEEGLITSVKRNNQRFYQPLI